MPRKIDTDTLDNAARDYAAMWLRPNKKSAGGAFVDGPGKVLQDLYNASYRDEYEYLREVLPDWMGSRAKADFEKRAAKVFTPREDHVFEAELAQRLAVTMDGDHREGTIGRVIVGNRVLGTRMVEVEAPWSIRRRKALGLPKSERETITRQVLWQWPIYAGEAEERQRPGGGAADDFPDGALGMSVGAAAMGISNEIALLACNAVVDQLDEGTGAAILRGYVATRPAGVDVALSGQTLLFTLVCSDPAFGAAADANPGATATASSITADSSADATGTLAFLRAHSTNDGATPLDDHVDGNAGTSDADFVFNTVSIVSGATVAMNSWTVTMPESQ